MKTKLKLNETLINSLDSVLDKNWAKLCKYIDISRSTLYRLKDNPAGIGMKQLLSICNGLKIPVSRFFYTGTTRTIGKLEDYVVDSYLPCLYDYGVLREIISDRHDITWVKAYEIIGITTDNLKKSLLSEDAPVNRVLDFCDAFDIDPFTVIIDPNPKRVSKRDTPSPTMLAEVSNMQDEIRKLTTATAELTKKYEGLVVKYNDINTKYVKMLDAYSYLLQRVDNYMSNSLVDLAAEPDI